MSESIVLASYTPEQIRTAAPQEFSDALERGQIVQFPECPFELPAASDLERLRRELPQRLKLKNVSYHPETDRVHGLDDAADLAALARRVLREHSNRLQVFLDQAMPTLTRGSSVGTCSFRPIQEKGRDLKPHASNELVHIDAGAYGATNGDRIFRFFVNVNPNEARVWVTKGAFPELYAKYGEAAGITSAQRWSQSLEKGPLDHVRTRLLKGIADLGLPIAMLLDSSPYDRVMRRFHNFMKDTPEFQANIENHLELRFKPFSAWMVLTDMVSHASLSGQHALVSTFIVPLENCQLKDMAPINILRAA